MTSMPSAASPEILSAPGPRTDQATSLLAAALRRTWHALARKPRPPTPQADPILADALTLVDLEARMRTYQRRCGL